MSIVVAIKHKDRIVLGSDRQVSTGTNKSHDTTKIWEIKDLPNALMGSVGSLRASQIIQFNNLFDLNDISANGGVDIGFIINSLVPNILANLVANGINCECTDESGEKITRIPNVILFAFNDKAWMIWNDLSVSELSDTLVIGSGADVGTGVLFATKHMDPFNRIVLCIDAAAESTLFVDNGVDILATKYYKNDKKLMAEALGTEIKSCDETNQAEIEMQNERIDSDKKETRHKKIFTKK